MSKLTSELTCLLQVGDGLSEHRWDYGLPVLLPDAVKQTGFIDRVAFRAASCDALRFQTDSLLQTDAELLCGQGGARRGGLH